jgi:exonuclease SbcC
MKITLIKLILVNFKGIRSLEVDFSHTTNIYGENASGKTTVFDAFKWLLFGKDSTDRKDFEIKTLNEDSVVIPKLEHEVTGIFDVDGQTVTLRRVLKEKWVKKRGSEEAEFTGNETLYFWNDVPMQSGEYQAKISGIVNEDIFKLITDPLYFNSIKWQDRRKVLLQLSGTINIVEILDSIATINNKQAIADLTNAINSNKSVVEYKREVSARKKLLNDSLKLIPSRIDEASRAKPEAVDYTAVQKELEQVEEIISSLDSRILKTVEAAEAEMAKTRNKMEEVHKMERRCDDIVHAVRRDVENAVRQQASVADGIRQEIRIADSTLSRLHGELQQKESDIAAKEAARLQLRSEWDAVDQKSIEFNAHEFTCPTCKRELEQEDISNLKEKLTANFNEEKVRTLSEISVKGKNLAATIEGMKKDAEYLNTQINALQDKIVKLNSDLEYEVNKTAGQQSVSDQVQAAIDSNQEYKDLQSDIAAKKQDLQAVPAQADTSDLQVRKKENQQHRDELKKKLATKDQIEAVNKRVAELEAEEKSLAQQIADIERVEFTIDQFSKESINILEQRINGRFQYVKFKLFDQQINGGESECCEALVNGVPFSDANNAAKINAGLDIINTLCDHHGVYAPIFIDNRESVNELIPCNSQIVNLIVSLDKN